MVVQYRKCQIKNFIFAIFPSQRKIENLISYSWTCPPSRPYDTSRGGGGGGGHSGTEGAAWGQNPLTIHEIYAALTPSDSRPEVTGLPSLLPLNTQTIINLKLKYVFPFIQCQCFDKRRGVYLVGKVSVLKKLK